MSALRTIEFITPESEAHWRQLRVQDITSTEVPALFGLSPYMTKAELWHAKKNQQELVIAENERMTWGKRLQDAIAAGIAADNKWKVEPFLAYCRQPPRRIGASFDYRGMRDDGPFLLEIKNVDGLAFRNGWAVEDDSVGLEAPAHIELQAQHQMHVLGIHQLVIGPLIGGNRVELLERRYYEETGRAIDAECEAFWRSIAANEPPPLDFERDLALIVRLSQSVSQGKVLEASERIDELARIYQAAHEAVKLAEHDKDRAKAELLVLIGDAERVLGNGYSISAGTTKRKEYVVAANEFRVLRVNFKKDKG